MNLLKASYVISALIFLFQLSMAENIVFQNGTNGYNGCTDSWIIMDLTTNNGDLAVIKVKGG